MKRIRILPLALSVCMIPLALTSCGGEEALDDRGRPEGIDAVALATVAPGT